jgi:uncharacterized protein YdhG (YjbR/CyaY superfamily)
MNAPSPASIETVDDYIATFPDDVRRIVRDVRAAVRRAAPEGTEAISYKMPTIKIAGRALVHFAAWNTHIGVYPVPVMDPAFESEVAPYRSTKDTLRFSYRAPIPYDLIERVVAELVRRQAR